MSNLTEKIQNNLAKASGENKTFDPVTIAIVLSIIYSVFKLFQECRKTPDEVVEVSANPTLLQRRFLHRKLWRELDYNTRKNDGDQIFNAMLETGKELTAEDVLEANNEIV
jgi:hypothetical protein